MTGFGFVLAGKNFQTLRDPSISSSEIIIFRCSDVVEITASSVFSVFLATRGVLKKGRLKNFTKFTGKHR